MKKWSGLLLSFFLIVGVLSIAGSLHQSKTSVEKSEEGRIILTQYKEKDEKRGGTESYIQLILKELKETVDGWLKSLNERIEREDVTRFEVRFLEILRSILEWVKEKIDSQIESSGEDIPEKKEEGRLREIHHRVSPFFEIG